MQHLFLRASSVSVSNSSLVLLNNTYTSTTDRSILNLTTLGVPASLAFGFVLPPIELSWVVR